MPVLLAGGVCWVVVFAGVGEAAGTEAGAEADVLVAGVAAGATAGREAGVAAGADAAGAVAAEEAVDFLDLVDFEAADTSLAELGASVVSAFLDFEAFLVLLAVVSAAVAVESAVSDFLDLEDFLVEEVSAAA